MGHPCWSFSVIVFLVWQGRSWFDFWMKGQSWVTHVGSIGINLWYWPACPFCCVGFWVGRIDLIDELAEARSDSDAGISSRTSALNIPSMTGCDCLSFIICKISATSFCGSPTSACASAKGLSKAMATSILPPSFLIRADRPVCILLQDCESLIFTDTSLPFLHSSPC